MKSQDFRGMDWLNTSFRGMDGLNVLFRSWCDF